MTNSDIVGLALALIAPRRYRPYNCIKQGGLIHSGVAVPRHIHSAEALSRKRIW